MLTACFGGSGGGRTLPHPDAWGTVEPSGTGFACKMPYSPKIDVEEGTSFDGTPIRTTALSGSVSNAAYGAVVIETRGGFIPDIRDRMQRAGGPSERDKDMKVRSRRWFEQNGFAVEEVVLESNEKQALIHMRHYLGRTRLYSAFFAYERAQEKEMAPLAQHFLSGVRLDPADASNPMGDGTLDFRAWTYIYPRSADFAIRLPGRGRFEAGRARLGDEEFDTETYRVGKPETGDFLVRVVAVNDRPKAGVLDRIAKILAGGTYRLTSEEPVVVQGYAGRRGHFRAQDGKEIEASYFVTNSRIYVVQASSPRPFTSEQRKAIELFFASFRIL